MKKLQKINICNLIGIICLIVGAGVLFWTSCLTHVNDIWFDELFTVELTVKPTAELLRLASGDVHPPLYYLIVRFFYLFFSLFSSKVNIIHVAKIVSIIPFILMMVTALTFIRSRFGLLSAGLFMIFVTCMPQLSQYMMEARMYSWSMFVVLAMMIHSLYAFDSVQDSNCGGLKLPHIIMVCLYGIAAMYLHYYAFIAAGIIVIILLTRYIIVKRQSRNFIRGLIILIGCILFCIVAYIPWIRVVLGQVGSVETSYWIAPVSWRTFPGCIKYIFKPEFESSIANYMVVGILVITYIYLMWGYIRHNTKADIYVVVLTCIIPVSLVVVGYIASILIRPVFIYRYMIPVLGIFWMGYGIILADACERTINTFASGSIGAKQIINCILCVTVLICIMLTGIRDFNMFRWEEAKKATAMAEADQMLNIINTEYSDELLVCNFNQVQAILWYYLGNESILWGETYETLVAEVCDRDPLIMTEDIEELTNIVKNHSGRTDSFLFAGSGNAREEIIDMWQQAGMQATLIYDSMLIERYYINIYRIEMP